MASPTYSPTSGSGNCFKFWYHLFGSSVGSISIWLRENKNLTKILWSRKENFGNQWRLSQVTVYSDFDHEIVLDGTVGDSYSGDAAFDDIELSNGGCEPEGYCNFETGFCGYYNTEKEDNFDWIRARGDTDSPLTGPSVDATTGTKEGYYVYIDSSPPQIKGNKAWLISEVIRAPQGACVYWNMHLFGNNIGSLNIYQRQITGQRNLLYSRDKSQGDFWIRESVDVQPTAGYFDIIFEGVVGDGDKGDIALDDLEIGLSGSCAYYNSTTTTQPTSTLKPPSAFQCDFETEVCDWYNDPTSSAQWIVRSGQNSSVGLAPTIDHTLESSVGKYVFVNSKLNENGLKTARLRSPLLSFRFDTCLEFWYQLSGPSASSLIVALRNNDYRYSLWEKYGNVADSWTHVLVNIPFNSTLNWLDFETDLTAQTSGYVAIDDIQLILGSCPPQKLCDFEDEDLCGYQHDITAKFKWTRQKGPTSSLNTGPPFDHTYQTLQGHYMYIETSNPPNGADARLISPTFKRQANGYCVTWWYHAYGATIGALNIYTRINNQLSAQPLWSIRGNQGDQWRVASITVKTISDFQIVFEGIAGSSFTGDIAIDDIFVDDSGPCQKAGKCDFEKSLCNWTPLATNKFNFLRISAQQLQSINPSAIQNGLLSDTTTNSKYGHFIWVGSGYYENVTSNSTTTLLSETFFARDFIVNGGCFSFMYFMNGPNIGTLTVYRKLHSNPQNIAEWTLSSDQGNKWVQAKVPISNLGDNFEILIEYKIVNQSLASDLAIDDVLVYDGSCSELPNPSAIFDCGDGNIVTEAKVCNFIRDCPNGFDELNCANCNFENSTCQYLDMSEGSLKWERGQAGSLQGNNGPPVDHTLGSPYGWYMYVNSNTGAFDYADLVLQQELKPCSSTCEIEFYYHMLGDTDDLVVYLLQGWPDYSYTNIFELYGDKGDRWNRGVVRLGRISSNFRIMFAAERFWFSQDSDVAIDDVRLTNCEFPPVRPDGCVSNDYFTCDRKACILKNRVCDLIDDCGDNSDEKECGDYTQCDFENGFCNWKNDLNEQLKWILNKGPTPTYYTGPSRDHTTGLASGSYVYLETSNVPQGAKARLISPVFINRGSCQFRVFYHMWGQDIGAFRILSRTSIGGGEKVYYSRDTAIGDFWERRDVVINEAQPFQIILEGIVGNGFRGDIGIDDTSFTTDCILSANISLPTVVTTSTSTTQGPCAGSFQCASNPLQCIPVGLVCDFKKDCSDGSDEVNCGTCNFEKSSCGWISDNYDGVDWIRQTGASNFSDGPQIDHTLGTNKGSYLVSDSKGQGGLGLLKSAILGATSDTCEFSLWVFMPASSELFLYFSNSTNPNAQFTTIGSITSPLLKSWKYFVFPLGPHPAGYMLELFSLTFMSGFNFGDIAIDDTAFINCGPSDFPKNKTLDCTFESGFCEYYQDTTADFLWERENKATPSAQTGPGFDRK